MIIKLTEISFATSGYGPTKKVDANWYAFKNILRKLHSENKVKSTSDKEKGFRYGKK